MTYPDFPGASDTSENPGRDLPANIWAPADGGSLQIYWELVNEGYGYEVAVQLVDVALLEQGDPGIIVWAIVDVTHQALPFSLYDEETGQELILGGRIEWVEVTSLSGGVTNKVPPQLWIKDAYYPGGGTTLAARIA
ncbi:MULTISPECIES: hypothetical protein [unclassified Xanthomonas]|uniref:hypothetical protein n=1 Tax=unclassified Xanthomonas TaxID=2643310 RepID=UPI002B231581|nr:MULTISPECIES: hypothetical protein [unclassified Xanthomonas]MEA9562725.1 hypothetical protein [Xanthomonas sp. WHRI 8932A]MEA9633778.1 hypothetical protein [Xanthomonas sp. WHRI 8812E]